MVNTYQVLSTSTTTCCMHLYGLTTLKLRKHVNRLLCYVFKPICCKLRWSLSFWASEFAHDQSDHNITASNGSTSISMERTLPLAQPLLAILALTTGLFSYLHTPMTSSPQLPIWHCWWDIQTSHPINTKERESPEASIHLVSWMECLPITVVQVQQTTHIDPCLSKVLQFTRHGCPPMY